MVPKRCLNTRAFLGLKNLTDTKRMASKSPSRCHPHKPKAQNESNKTTYRCGRGGWSHALEPTPSPLTQRRTHSLTQAYHLVLQNAVAVAVVVAVGTGAGTAVGMYVAGTGVAVAVGVSKIGSVWENQPHPPSH